MNISNKEKLVELVSMIFEFEDMPELKEIRQSNMKNWDSMMIANLVLAVESEFNVSISNTAYEEFTSFLQIEAILDEKGI